MYCPRCSQQQVTDDVSFCSRCGFQLGAVKALLLTDGAFPARAIYRQSGFLATGRKSVRRGAKLIFFSLVSLPVFFALSFINDSPIPLLLPALAFLAGLTLVFYTWIFGEDILPSKQEAKPPFFGGIVSSPNVLLQPGSSRGELGAARANTAEMIKPPSITEHTTKLL
jgi:hypothetical protein